MSGAAGSARAEELFGIAGRAYVVTGAASGLGAAIAATLAANGAQLLLLDSQEHALAEAAQGIRAMGAEATSVVVDVTDANGVGQAIDRFARDCRRLDGLFANAGVSGGPGFGTAAGAATGRLENQVPAQCQRLLNVNLLGTLNCVQAAVPSMKRQGCGSIVVTASISGLHSEPFVSYAYAASKAAAVQLVRQAALELAPHGIRVNAVAPGFIKTGIAGGKLHDPAVADSLVQRIPMGRLGLPTEIQGVALLLASDASAYMTGCTIPIDGGVLLGAATRPVQSMEASA
ncbi:SDR family NAD(P)-dependent oxidoreductase [Variovorax sp. ZT4R33]|uniref:SDR family NAD(P)-dependent oxidoreductase n=1 Tax=Variovorax sp. ZT4R33 TaxID=3443743 RepID=UPI003F45E858